MKLTTADEADDTVLRSFTSEDGDAFCERLRWLGVETPAEFQRIAAQSFAAFGNQFPEVRQFVGEEEHLARVARRRQFQRALQLVLHDDVAAKMDKGAIQIDPRSQTKRARSQWGTARTLVNNLMTGVTKGFEEKLEITGVGYRAVLQGKNLQLALGYSHDVVYAIPEGITIVVPKPTEITITGTDSQRVGQVAAEIRAYRPPEPYKGKGVKYANEFIFRKEGKKK